MKNLLSISFRFFSVLILVFILSCSAPADKWSCSKLHSEINSCKQHILDAKYNRSQYLISETDYNKQVKDFEDAIAYYEGRLKYCKELVITANSNVFSTSEIPNKEQNDQKKEKPKINSESKGIEGTWKLSSDDNDRDTFSI